MKVEKYRSGCVNTKRALYLSYMQYQFLALVLFLFKLGEYARAFRQKPMEPMVSLLMGLCFLQMACKKSQYGRNASIVQVRDL